MKALATLAFLCITGLFMGNAFADLLYTVTSPSPQVQGYFGHSVTGVGDVDGDGFSDIAVGARYENAGADGSGRAYVFSGFNGQLIHAVASPNPEDWGFFGCRVSGAGDVNGDGRFDIVIGAFQESGAGIGEAGRAYIFSGSDGALLQTLQSPNPEDQGFFGYWAAGAGDVNGDDIGDVVIGAHQESPGTWRAGRAYLFSGQGNLLYTFTSPNSEEAAMFGAAVAGAGDVNGDGYDDVIIGALNEDIGEAFEAGRAYVFSGQNGGLLYTLESPMITEAGIFGSAVSGGGDFDGDGLADIVVGAWREEGGRVYTFSGFNGDIMDTLETQNPDPDGWFGNSVACAGDMNNDGFDDVIVGAPLESSAEGWANAGWAYVYSGRTGDPLFTYVSPAVEWDGSFGVSVAGIGDVNDDGFDDVIIGADYEDGGAESAGKAHVFGGVLPAMTKLPLVQIIDLGNPSPNPSHGQMEVLITIPEGHLPYAKLGLFDIAGRAVDRVELPLSSERDVLRVHWSADAKLAAGMYYWRLTTDMATSCRLWVLIR